MSFELGDFSFKYRSLAVHGFGISASSNFAVLYQASQLFLKNGPPLDLEQVAYEALKFDRQLAGGLYVAADDVYPIVYGGVIKVLTQGQPPEEHHGVTFTPIVYSGKWIADHVIIAVRPRGIRHEVKNLLNTLAEHDDRVQIVRTINGLAEKAAVAIELKHLGDLADAVKEYREIFNKWTRYKYINSAVDAMKDKIVAKYGKHILAWKPPGGGASEAIALIVEDHEIRDCVVNFLRSETDWWCSPLYVSSGICGEFVKTEGRVRITAGHRLDFVGGADVGQDPDIAENGICCSCAIEPRSEIILEQKGV